MEYLTNEHEKIPDEFLCPISFQIMINPIICNDGYTYDITSILLLKKPESPFTKNPINFDNLILNRIIKDLINKYINENKININYQNYELIIKKIVMNNGDTIKHFPYANDEIKILALEQNGLAIQYIINPTDQMKMIQTANRQNSNSINRYMLNPSTFGNSNIFRNLSRFDNSNIFRNLRTSENSNGFEFLRNQRTSENSNEFENSNRYTLNCVNYIRFGNTYEFPSLNEFSILNPFTNLTILCGQYICKIIFQIKIFCLYFK